jgi:hypothetical protein
MTQLHRISLRCRAPGQSVDIGCLIQPLFAVRCQQNCQQTAMKELARVVAAFA